jgi:hypothetical protein
MSAWCPPSHPCIIIPGLRHLVCKDATLGFHHSMSGTVALAAMPLCVNGCKAVSSGSGNLCLDHIASHWIWQPLGCHPRCVMSGRSTCMYKKARCWFPSGTAYASAVRVRLEMASQSSPKHGLWQRTVGCRQLFCQLETHLRNLHGNSFPTHPGWPDLATWLQVRSHLK